MTGLESLALDSDKPFEVVLKHPATGRPLLDQNEKPAHVLVLGQDSAAAQKAKRQATQNALSRRSRMLNAEDLEAQNVEFLVAITTGWHLVNFAGEAVNFEFSSANARKLYSDRQFAWIKDQVDEAVGDRGNFLKTSTAS